MKEAKEGRKECIINVQITAVNGLSEPETLLMLRQRGEKCRTFRLKTLKT